MMTTKPIGLYVHIPFCLRKCNYCDFCSFSDIDSEMRGRYIEALKNEISSYKREIPLRLDTIFFGGGTPSILSAEEFTSICDTIKETFLVDGGAEFSIEANPKTLTEEKIRAYISAGVNRVSIGLQTIHENERIKLGRIHDLDDFKKAYKMVKEMLTDNVGIDLMYGIPYQTVESFEKTLRSVISFEPRHISCYGLIIEEGTPFYNEGAALPLPSEDDECDMYDLASRILSENGYLHYEISNYSKPGFESRHNLKYWELGEYIGVGLAAHSCFEGKRFYNTEDMAVYLSEDREQYSLSSEVSSDDLSYDFVMLGLRLRSGISLSEYSFRFGKDFLSDKKEKILEFVRGGYMTLSEDRLALTERGFYVSNTILTELL